MMSIIFIIHQKPFLDHPTEFVGIAVTLYTYILSLASFQTSHDQNNAIFWDVQLCILLKVIDILEENLASIFRSEK
jgi:hypothetical protein